ncbi:gfo/Idh/MocA family oxidoreductase, partial [candidate division KSB1 bacterium]
MQQVKVGVVGVGKLGYYHTVNYKQNPQAQLAGLYDVNLGLAKKVATEFEIPF